MSLLFETIRIEEGMLKHLRWHEERMNRARAEVWGATDRIRLSPEIDVPADYSTGLVQCNVRYGPEIEQIEFKHYDKRIVRSLKLVEINTIDYHLKFSDRSLLHVLFAQRGSSDEILIVRDGFITDTSMSNIIFFDGVRWVTPSDPLLKGTCRDRLLVEGRISETDIRPADLGRFTGCKLINAMREPEEEEMIPVTEIS